MGIWVFCLFCLYKYVLTIARVILEILFIYVEFQLNWTFCVFIY
jgi:hypothetical protein